MKRFVKCALLSFAMVSMFSCGTSKVMPISGEWVIEEVNGKKTAGDETPSIGFNLQDSTVYGNNSCNRFFGSIVYSDADATAISFSNVGATRMLCPNSPMEEEIQSAINYVASFSYVDGGNAQLLDKDGAVLLLLSPKKGE